MRLLLTLFIGTLMVFTAKAQDPAYTQLYSNSASRNPAFTGILLNPQINLKYRNQWTDFRTCWLEYDQRISERAGNVGAYYSADFGGFIRTDAGGIRYSKAFKIGEKTGIVSGVDLGLFRCKIIKAPCVSIDPVTFKCTGGDSLVGLTSPTAFNTNAGILFFTGKFFAGISVLNLNEPNQSFYNNPDSRIPRHYVVECGGFISLHRDDPKSLIIAPHLMIENQFIFTRAVVGFQVTKGIVTGGVSYVQTDPNPASVNFLLGATIKRYRIGYSYDYYLISDRFGAAHELSLRYVIGKPRKGSESEMPFYFRKLF